jgi:hypothetical protein
VRKGNIDSYHQPTSKPTKTNDIMSNAITVTAGETDNAVFAGDDEETWRLLVSLGGNSNDRDTSITRSIDMGQLLTELAIRVHEDWGIIVGKDNDTNNGTLLASGGGEEEYYWKVLVDEVRTYGFDYSIEKSKSLQKRPSNQQNDLVVLAAFQTEAGMNHLTATSALLRISQERAVQVTMGALRSIAVLHSSGSSSLTTNDGSITPIPKPEGEEEKKEEVGCADSSSLNKNNNFASLLGSRELLVKTMLFHYQQRFARLSVITECLRLEQDPDFVQREVVVDFLNSLDGTFTNSIYSTSATTTTNTTVVDRGLLKNLLTVACQPDPEPSRQAFEPSKVLEVRSIDNISLSSSYRLGGGRGGPSSSSKEQSFQPFCASLLAEHKAQTLRERVEAMEALLVLLYERIQGGVLRSDYSLLLISFFCMDGGGTAAATTTSLTVGGNGEQPRLSYLKGLICAESMALWRAFESTTGKSSDNVDNNNNSGIEENAVGGDGVAKEMWPASNHPMLLEWNMEAGRKEIESLTLILKRLLDASYSGSIAITDSRESPVSLAVLSFGLLLYLVKNARSDSLLVPGDNPNSLDLIMDGYNASTLAEIGSQLIHTANDVCGSFDYLMKVLDALSSPSLHEKESSVVRDEPYDWQLSEPSNMDGDTLLLENGQQSCTMGDDENATPADIVTYTSIAREVIAASIAAFPQTLAIDQPISCQDLKLLCTVTAKIYHKNDRLCQQFWDVWELYLIESSDNQHYDQRLPNFPICRLLDGAHKFATAALNSLWNQQISSQSYMSAVSPFFQLLGALCNTPKITESIIGMLPTTMIRSTLLCCESSSTSTQDSDDSVRNRISILNAFQAMAAVSKNSKTCLELVRNSLEEDPQILSSPDANQAWEGPRILARILNGEKKAAIINPVLGVMAHLLDNAPSRWVQLLGLEFVEKGEGPNPTSKLISFMNEPGYEVSHSAVLVLRELVGHLDFVVFGDCLPINDAVAFLQSLGAVLLSASTCLSTWVSKGPFLSSSSGSSILVESADCVLRSFAIFLKLIRTVILLHTSPAVCEAATLMRDRLIGTLATNAGLGESIIYYAIAPVSLGIVVKMDDVIRDKSLLEQLANKSGEASANFWQSRNRASSYARCGSSILDMVKSQVLKFVSAMNHSDFDIEGVRARGWVHSHASSGLCSMNAAFSALDLLSQWASHVEDIAQSHSNEVLANQAFPLSGKAADLISQLSPQRLICTLAPMPPPCRANVELSMLWQSMGMSTFELLLPYLQPEEVGTTAQKEYDLPVSEVLDLLMACISQVISTTSAKNMTDSPLVQAVYNSNAQFSSILWKIVDNGFRMAESFNGSDSLSKAEKSYMVHFFGALRLISKCVSSDATVAVKVLQLEDDRWISKLVKGALMVQEALDLSGSKRIFDTAYSILSMRMALGCIDVISAMCKMTRSFSPMNADSVRMLLIQTVDQQSSFIRELVKVSSAYAAMNNLDERIAVSSEADCARVSMSTFFEVAFGVLATEAVYTSSTDRGALASDFLMEFSQSGQLLRFQGYQSSIYCAGMFAEAQRSHEAKNLDPCVILRSFPVTSSSILSNDFYAKENAFNINSSSKFLSKIDKDRNELLDDTLKKVSTAYLQCHSELALMQSWATFLSVTLMTVFESTANRTGRINPQQLSVFAGEGLQALSENINSASAAKVKNAKNLMTTEATRMTKILSDLLLTQLEFGAFTTLAEDELLLLLGVLCKTIDGFHDTTCPPTNIYDLEVSNQFGQYQRLSELF